MRWLVVALALAVASPAWASPQLLFLAAGKASVVSDTTPPTVTAFSVGSPTYQNVPVTSFTATDNIAVTGYKITESSSAPSAGGGGWTGSAPSTYDATGVGSITLYAWAKDGAGNVSTSATTTTTTTDFFSTDYEGFSHSVFASGDELNPSSYEERLAGAGYGGGYGFHAQVHSEFYSGEDAEVGWYFTNWILSKEIILVEGQTISFWYKTSYPLTMGTAGGSSYTAGGTSGDYALFTHVVTAGEAGTRIVAIRGYAGLTVSQDEEHMDAYIDNIRITGP